MNGWPKDLDFMSNSFDEDLKWRDSRMRAEGKQIVELSDCRRRLWGSAYFFQLTIIR